MTKHHIIKILPKDVGLNQTIKPRNSELRSKVLMLTSRTGSSRLLRVTIKSQSPSKSTEQTLVHGINIPAWLMHITYAGPVTCCLLRCQIPYHPVANQCYSQFIHVILWIECYSKEQPAIIMMQISHIREW